MTDATPIAGLLLGLASSAHCLAMCGGVVSALDRMSPQTRGQRVAAHLLYAVGRLSSYALLGGLAGSLSFAIADALGPQLAPRIQVASRFAVGVMLIALGIRLAGVQLPAWLPRADGFGRSFWRRLNPLARHLAGLPRPLRAVGLGALWGFLPCGMVYGASAVAMVTGSTGRGALFMAAFGLGTLPAIFSMGVFAAGAWEQLGRRNLRRGSALALALCGFWTLLGPGLLALFATAHH